MMTKTEVLNDIRKTLGAVPGFFETVPDEVIEEEWNLFKKEVTSTTIPSKLQHLIGLGVASAIRCKYCVYFHTALAKAFGATDDELNAAVRQAKQVVGWSTYVHGVRYDEQKFMREVDEMVSIMKSQKREPAGVR